MSTTGSQRAAASRKRMKAQGWRYLTHRYSPAALDALAYLKGEDETAAGVICRALREAARRKRLFTKPETG